MTKDDLMRFCADEDDPRWWMQKPFTQGVYTYATNGHIVIRVPRMDGFEERDNPRMDTVFNSAPQMDFMSLPTDIPPVTTEACPWCGGSGKEMQNGEEFECVPCDGEGRRDYVIRIAIGAAELDNKYCAMIAALPGAMIGNVPKGNELKPIPFTFDGGDGLVMGMRV